jgi:hypothetical protein
MCYFILKGNGQVVVRSTVRSADMNDPTIKKRVQQLDKDIEDCVGSYDGPDDETAADDDEPDEYHDAEENDKLISAEVLLQDEEGETAKAQVIERKRDTNREVIGQGDSREYVVRFPSGREDAYTASILNDTLYSLNDDDGNRWYIMDSIVSHRRGKGGRGRTRGWLLEVQWKDGSTTWETLSLLKDSNPIEVAQYAVENQLEQDPAFAHWVNIVLRSKDRVIQMARKRRMYNRFQYGVEIPRSVKHALELDKKNGNNFWANAIKKEMDKVMVAFKILKRGEAPPKDSKCIPLHMVFTVKMDFQRKYYGVSLNKEISIKKCCRKVLL